MPYSRDGKCVKDKNGKTLKCHDSVEKAEAHLRALRVNVEAQEKAIPVQYEFKAHSQGSAGATFVLNFSSDSAIWAVQVLAKALMGDDPDRIVRWLPPYQFHLTLVSTSLLDDDQLRGVMAKLPAEIGRMPITLGPIDIFEQDDRTVLILRAEPTDALVALQRMVYDAVSSVGAPISEFSQSDHWQPHVTLAYAQPGTPAPEFAHTITASPRALLATRASYYSVGYVPDVRPEPDDEQAEMRSMKSLVKSIVQKLLRQQPTLTDASGFKVEGNRWFAWYTNNWYDLEAEVFPVKAIDYYIQRVKGGDLPYPALWFSHLKSLPHGQADHLIRVGNMVLAAGTFDDSVLAHRMKTYYREATKRGVRFRVSHGFKYATRFKIRGAYYLFETYEISPIPEVGSFRAANPYTQWEVKTMQIPDELRREIAAALSEDGKTVNEGSLKRADTVIAEARTEMAKAEGEGRHQKNTLTPEDVNTRVDTLEKTFGEKFEAFQTAFDDKMGKALSAFETGVKTNVEAASKFDEFGQRFDKVDARLKALEDWQKQQGELAPPASRSALTQLPADSALAKYLAEREASGDKQHPPSLVEMLTGEKSAQIDAAHAANGTGAAPAQGGATNG